MLNIEKYKDEIIAEWRESEESDLLEDISVVAIRHGKSLGSIEQVVDWLCEEYQESLLTDDEKAQIRAFKKALPTLERIEKHGVLIYLQNSGGDIIGSFIILNVYKKILECVTYTLEELGL